MRQAGGAEHQRHAERDAREIGSLMKLPGPMIDSPTCARLRLRPGWRRGSAQVGLDLDRAARTAPPGEKPNCAITMNAMKRRAGQQQHRLDDLHPGGREHAAEQHVDHHQHADDDHRVASSRRPNSSLISWPAPTICAIR